MRSLNPDQGGSDLMKLETAGRLQILQKVGTPSEENGNLNPAGKGNLLYVGITPHEPSSIREKENGKENKKDKNMEKERKKVIRRVEDGLLLVVPTEIYGKSI